MSKPAIDDGIDGLETIVQKFTARIAMSMRPFRMMITNKVEEDGDESKSWMTK